MKDDIIGLIRVLKPRYTEAGQRTALAVKEVNTRCVLDLGNTTREELLRMTRPGTVIAILHLHLLADPKRKRQKGGMRADLWEALDLIEKKGGVVWELYTGLKTSTREGRDMMTREAVETLARGRHKTERSDKRGRPEKKFTDAEWTQAKTAWDSRKLKRWVDVKAKLPKGMTLKRAWAKFGPRNTENT